MKTPRFTHLLLAAATLFAASSATAADIVKADNTTALNLTGSWVGGVLPGAGDIAVFNNTLTAGRTAAIGADASWEGIKFNGAVGTQTIDNALSTNTLSLGTSGVDFTGAVNGSSLIIKSKVSLTGAQTWNVSNSLTTGDDLKFDALTAGSAFNLGGFKVTKSGAGTSTVGGGYTVSNGTFDVDAGTLTFAGGGGRATIVNNTVTVNVASSAALQVATNSGAGSAFNQVTNLNGGTLQFNGGANTSVATVNLGAATTSTIDILTTSSGNTPVFGIGSLAGAGNVNFTRTGTDTTKFNLTGTNNTFTGNTSVGSGAVVTLADNAGFSFVIGSNGVNNGISGTGTLNLNGDFTFNLTGAGTTLGDSWQIVNNATLTETFGASFTVVGATDLGGNKWAINNGGLTYTFDEATGSLSVSAVPEPSTYGLIGAGALAAAAMVRRRRKHS